jgi:hypothetical protein
MKLRQDEIEWWNLNFILRESCSVSFKLEINVTLAPADNNSGSLFDLLAGLLYLAARKYVAESAQRQTVRRSPPETHETSGRVCGKRGGEN